MDINEFTEAEDKVYCDKINEDFIYFLQAIPYIEYCDEFEGKTIKLRVPTLDDRGNVDWGAIFLDLQWMLHTYKQRNPDLVVEKMLVGELKLIPASIAKALNVRRGFCIKINYQLHPTIKAPLSN